MINWIWLGMIAIAVIVGGASGRIEEVSKAAFSSAKVAVEIAIGLVGVMAMWLGVMKVAEEAGIVRWLGRAVRPALSRVFPEIPRDHPALGSMTANIAANMLGLGNSATPLGLKAMQDLQELNQDKPTATNAMVTFIVINATSVTVIPATIIALRKDAANPTSILLPSLIATAVSTAVGIIISKLMQRYSKPGNTAS
ncbi:nucleoside recognition protein [candidate division KSB1 bacterium]|nr:nucleoside recognition protein [candidate division KSB1 bacterium]